jgi:arylsulfatase A-like enzyme
MRVVIARNALTVVLLFVAALTPGCRSGDDAWEGQDTYRLQGVVLIMLDTVRADRLGCYGYEKRPTSPHLDVLSGEGVRFSQTVTTSPWTLPSVAAMLAGQYSERVFADTLASSVVESLQQAGIETAAITEGGFVSKAFAFDRGFDEWTEEEGEVQLLKRGQRRDPDKQGGIDRTFAAAERWLSRRHPGRFFLFVHTYEPHTPYTNHDFTEGLDSGRVGPVFSLGHVRQVTRQEVVLTEAETEYIDALYDGDIASADRHLGRLLAKLDERGLADRVAVIVTSDHGEELGQHYPHKTGDHGHALLDTMMLVPLIIRDPGGRYSTRVIDDQVRIIDVLPTVADLLDVPVEPSLDGRSLLPLMNGNESGERLALIGQAKAGPARVGLRSMGHKYIKSLLVAGQRRPLFPMPPPQQLYDLAVDPQELDNLADRRPEMARTLDELLQQRHPGQNVLISPDVANDVDPELIERLKSLGYLQ